jgi:hypothetical protein
MSEDFAPDLVNTMLPKALCFILLSVVLLIYYLPLLLTWLSNSASILVEPCYKFCYNEDFLLRRLPRECVVGMGYVPDLRRFFLLRREAGSAAATGVSSR